MCGTSCINRGTPRCTGNGGCGSNSSQSGLSVVTLTPKMIRDSSYSLWSSGQPGDIQEHAANNVRQELEFRAKVGKSTDPSRSFFIDQIVDGDVVTSIRVN